MRSTLGLGLTWSSEVFSVKNIVEKDFIAADPGPHGGRLERSGGLPGLQLPPQPRHVVTPELGLLCRPVELREVVK